MIKRLTFSVIGMLILIGFYLFYQDQQHSKSYVECVSKPDQMVINLYIGENLRSSTGLSLDEIVYWRKGMDQALKLNRFEATKEFNSINPEQGHFTFEQKSPEFSYRELISKECFEAIP